MDRAPVDRLADGATTLGDRPAIELVISPGLPTLVESVREIWRYRELLLHLISKELKVRYKQTLLGASWAVLQPVAATVIFTVFFGRVANLPSDGIPYPLFVYTGMVAWTLIANGITAGTTSLVTNANLLSKIYFPRALIPAAVVGAGVVDFAIAMTILAALLVGYHVMPGFEVVLLPLFALLAVALTYSSSLVLSILTAKYRDIRYVVPFVLQLMLFVSPVIYPTDYLPSSARWVVDFNPATSILNGLRYAVEGTPAIDPAALGVTVCEIVCLFVWGLHVFRKLDATVADSA